MSSSNRHEIRQNRKTALLGTLAGWIIKLWAYTLRYELEDRIGVCTPGRYPHPLIFVLWHNRIFVVPPFWQRTGGSWRSMVVLTSASKDGSLLARAMAVFGMGAVRGSSSRRGVAALVGLKRTLREGHDVCVTPDGPRGPRYQVHPGVIKLAQSSGVPIVPVHVHVSRAWRLKTWDRFVVPWPFSRVRVIFDPMLAVPRELDETAFEAERVRVEAALLAGADDV